jgi:plastocyanin
MKFSAALAASVAPLAFAKAVRNSYPVRRDPQGASISFSNGMAGFGITETSLVEVILIWANPGGGAATQTLNQQVTVTQTVTVNGAAGATQVAGVQGTTTIAAGATGTVAGTGATHSVTVGGPAGLVFTPDNIKAAIGDMVVFTFLGNNHTASQSAFAAPCDVLAGGMDSGFMANPNSTVTPPPQVAMQVMVAEPLCKRAPCLKNSPGSCNSNNTQGSSAPRTATAARE